MKTKKQIEEMVECLKIYEKNNYRKAQIRILLWVLNKHDLVNFQIPIPNIQNPQKRFRKLIFPKVKKCCYCNEIKSCPFKNNEKKYCCFNCVIKYFPNELKGGKTNNGF